MKSSTARALRQRAYREVIFDAAEAIFAEHGFEGAHMQSISALAGLSIGTIYEVIGSKDALFREVFVRRLPAILEAASTAGADATTAVERLVLGMRAYVDFMLAHPDWMRIHLNAHPWGIGPTRGGPERAAWEEGHALHSAVLAMAMEEGTVKRCDPSLLAPSLAAIQQVHLAQWVRDGMEAPASEVREGFVEFFRGSFLSDAGRKVTESI